jgi:hypothetical protein
MSETNPFEAQYNPGQGAPPKPVRSLPIGVTIIAVICLIMGLMNSIGVCVTIPALFLDVSSNMQPNEEAKEAARAAASANFLPNLLQLIVGLIFVPMIIASSIGALMSKEWGRKFLVISLFGFAAWGLFAIGNVVYTCVFQMDMVMAQAQAQAGGGQAPNQPSEEMMKSIMIGTFIGMSLLFAVFVAFYVFSAFYLRKKDIVDYFASK